MSRAEGLPPECSVPCFSASFLRGDDGVPHLRLGLDVALLAPGADPDEMVLEPDDRIAERPGIGFGLGPVGRRVVRGGMRADPVGDVFDEGRTEIAARPLDRPFGDRVHRQVVVAVDPEGCNTEAEATGGKGAGPATGNALERSRSPTGC